MAKKKENLERALGLPEEIDGFIDGKGRKAYPPTLAEMPEFMRYANEVSINNFVFNFLDDQGVENLKHLLGMIFKDDKPEDIMAQINKRNFTDIMLKVLSVAGLELADDTKN